MSIETLGEAIMRGVVRAGVVTPDNIDLCIRVMRQELKDFLLSDTYANERDCVLRRSVPDSYITASIIAACVHKIAQATPAPTSAWV